jgi:hypothetical protein
MTIVSIICEKIRNKLRENVCIYVSLLRGDNNLSLLIISQSDVMIMDQWYVKKVVQSFVRQKTHRPASSIAKNPIAKLLVETRSRHQGNFSSAAPPHPHMLKAPPDTVVAPPDKVICKINSWREGSS